MGCGPQLKTSRARLLVEPAASAEIPCNRVPQIVRAMMWIGVVRLLRLVAVLREISVEITWKNLVRNDGFHCWKPDIKLTSSMVRGPVNAASGDFRLKNRRNRLGLAWKPALHPFELRRV
jgi:hypothetical protein